jgi:hypothetical protein
MVCLAERGALWFGSPHPLSEEVQPREFRDNPMPARIIRWHRRDLTLKRIYSFIEILDRKKFIISGPTHSA